MVTRGAATRDALLAAAAALIPEVGWGAVTTRAVADRAGVRPGLVHYHFDSVEALLVAAATSAADDLVAGVRTTLDATDDLDSGIDALATAVTGVADDPALLLLTEASLAGTRIPPLRHAFAAALDDLRLTIARWLADRGYDGDPAPTAAVLAAALDGWALHRAADPSLDPTPLRQGLHALVDQATPRT
jgi:AcrR family transcriptional regulator